MFEPGKPIVTLTDAAATQVRALMDAADNDIISLLHCNPPLEVTESSVKHAQCSSCSVVGIIATRKILA